MRRSDSAAQRGTSISHPTPPQAGPSGPRALAFPPSSGGGRSPRTTGPRRTAPAGRVVVDLPVRHGDRRHVAADVPATDRRPLTGAPADRLTPGAAVRLDRRVVGLLRDCGGDPRVAGAVRVLGLAGEHGAVWLAAGAAGALGDAERRAAWLRATALVGAAHAASMGVKRLVRRPRPGIPGMAPLVATAGRHSFPSSHATSSVAAVIAFGALLPGTAVVPVLAAAICVSRLVAGVHYPSDVLCGALLGAAAAGLGRTWALGAATGATAGGRVPAAYAAAGGGCRG